MNEEEKLIFEEMYAQLPPEIKEAFDKAVASSGLTQEQFVEGLWDELRAEGLGEGDWEIPGGGTVGECPECGSEHTVSGDEIEQIDDPTIAYCDDCGLLWCLECAMSVPPGGECGHWDVCAECTEEKDEFDDCGVEASECPFIVEWQSKVAAERFTGVCAWCGVKIPEGDEVFGTGAKIREGIDFVQPDSTEGFFMEVTIGGRRVPTVVTGTGSDARLQGNDLMFMTCSMRCAEELRDTLERERDIIEKAQLN